MEALNWALHDSDRRQTLGTAVRQLAVVSTVWLRNRPNLDEPYRVLYTWLNIMPINVMSVMSYNYHIHVFARFLHHNTTY